MWYAGTAKQSILETLQTYGLTIRHHPEIKDADEQ